MKIFVGVLLLLLVIGQVQAQNLIPVHEVGLVFNNLDQFGIRYKVGHDNIRYRITATSLGFDHTDYDDDNTMYESSSDWGISLSGGIEKHRLLTEDFSLYFGSDLSLGYTAQKEKLVYPNDNMDINYTTIGLSGILGARYQFAQSFSLSAELAPTVYYEHISGDTNFDSDYWNFSFSSYQATLCLAYQF